MIFFRYNEKLNEYQELKIENNVQIRELLDPDLVLLLVDEKRYRIWIWYGSNTSTRTKFIVSDFAQSIREKEELRYEITDIDEGNEPIDFKIMIGLDSENRGI